MAHIINKINGFLNLPFTIILFTLLCALPQQMRADVAFNGNPVDFDIARPTEANVSSQSGTISIPIRIEGQFFTNVSSFQFFIGFDAAKITFAGQTPGSIASVTANAQGNIITVNWANPNNPQNFTSSTIVSYLLFTRIASGDVSLEFLHGSRVATPQNLLPVQYINGNITTTYNLQVLSNPSEGGSTSGTGEYMAGQSVSLQATANTGYTFNNWTRNGIHLSSNASFNYTMPAEDATVIANFLPNSFQVTTQSVPINGGILTGAGVYDFGQQVNVTATPNAGYNFVNWTLNGTIVSTQLSYSFVMPNEAVNLMANFQLIDYTVSVNINPSIGGTVNGTGTYNFNNQVHLTANAATGYSFSSWKMNDVTVSTSSAYSFSMPASNVDLTANFTINSHQVSTQAIPPTGGTLSGSGIYNFGQVVQVSATPGTGYSFVNWTRNSTVVSTNPVYSFEMPDAPVQLVANFQIINYNLTASVSPAASGVVAGAGAYAYNAPVQMIATAAAGYHFSNWTINNVVVSNNATYNFNMPAAHLHLVAKFEANSYNVQVQANNAVFGNVTGSGSFQHNSFVTVSATPNPGYIFVSWTENSQVVSNQATYVFPIFSNRNLTANFELAFVCPPPSNLVVNNIGLTFAQFVWTPAPQTTSFDVLWGAANFDTLSQGTLVGNIGTNSLTINTLTAQTAYDYYVRTRCDNNTQSRWAGPKRFSTYYVGVPNIAEPITMRLFPNPIKVNGSITIALNTNGIFKYELINSRGAIVQRGETSFNERVVIQLKTIPVGVYTLRTDVNNHLVSKKIVITE